MLTQNDLKITKNNNNNNNIKKKKKKKKRKKEKRWKSHKINHVLERMSKIFEYLITDRKSHYIPGCTFSVIKAEWHCS